MAKIKLNEFCKKQGIHYITGNRWFHAGKIPGAIQTESGTILVDEDALIGKPSKDLQTEATTLLLKKTTEISKNNGTVEDLAAYVVSNFNLQIVKGEEKQDLKSLVKNDDGEGNFMRLPKNPPNSISLDDLSWNSHWNSQIQIQPTGNLMAWNGNPTFGAATLNVSAQTEPSDFSFYGSQNAACGGGSIAGNSVFYSGPTTPNLSDIVGVENQKETAVQIPEQPPKRGRGRPKKIEGEEK